MDKKRIGRVLILGICLILLVLAAYPKRTEVNENDILPISTAECIREKTVTLKKSTIVRKTELYIESPEVSYSESDIYTSDDDEDAISENATESELESDTTVTYTYAELNEIMYVKQSVNVRDEPSVQGEKIGHMNTGESVTVTGQCNETGWYQIIYEGETRYCSNNYLSSSKPASYTYTSLNKTMYTTRALNVRSGPSIDYSLTNSLSKGEAVTVIGRCNETGWYRIYCDGAIGYCSSYLTYTKPSDSDAVENSNASNTDKSSDSGNSSESNSNSSDNSKDSSFKTSSGSNSGSKKESIIVIETEGSVNALVEAFANTELRKIPSRLAKKFINDGWKIVLTDKDIANTYADEGYAEGTIAGITIYADKVIYVQNSTLKDYDGDLYTSVLHEIGHWLDVTLYDGKHYISAESEFMTLYEAEKDAYVAAFGTVSTDPVKEFFAHCFYRYITEPDKFAEVCPGIKSWFDEALEEYM